MLAMILLAQLYGPACGWNYGVEITPQNSPFQGCTVPDANGKYRVRLRMDPFSPGGVRAEPAGPPEYPVYGQ
ncbi:MAG: hypothetical protein RLZZ106_57 [Cyanobacteriota bacterium]|jgi:hypothetical protein